MSGANRYPLRARTLDDVEMVVLRATMTAAERKESAGTWYEITCSHCRTEFSIHARSLDAVVKRYGFVYCANALCGVRLYAVTADEVQAIAERRSRA
jgi:hypothetical protein